MHSTIKYLGAIFCAIAISATASAQDDQAAVTGINLAVVMPPAIQGLNDNNVELIHNKLVNILTNNGLSSDDQDKTFIITPSFVISSSGATAGTLRKLEIVHCVYTLFIKQNSTKTIFSTYTKNIDGSGLTKDEALQSAVSQAGNDEAGIAAFIERAKTKIGAYYQANCQQFTGSADREIAQGHYDAAQKILLTIPQEAGDCYATAQTKMGDIYQKQYGSLDKAAVQLEKDNVVHPAGATARKLVTVQKLLDARADQDKTPPVILLITPKTTRGQFVEADVKNNDIYVSGSAKDASGVATVTVNGKTIDNVTADGFFNTKINQNEPDIVINATDKKGNTASLTYHIASKAVTSATVTADEIKPLADNEKFHAIFIANSEYSGGKWPPLPTTVNEARSLMKMLESKYNFDPANVDTIFNRSRHDMAIAIDKKLSSLGPNDNVVIYYAGHGQYDDAKKTAYWVPLGAEDEADYISNDQIDKILTACQAKHILVMADACFSGAMRGGVDAPAQYEYTSKSRQLLASGGTEPVPGESVFVKMLLEKLDQNTDKFMTVRDLQSRIYPGIKNGGHTECTIAPLQVPGSEGGQFYFKKN